MITSRGKKALIELNMAMTYCTTIQRKCKFNNEEIFELIKRPIKVDDSNNIFYINHNGENKRVKVDPGVYKLTELSSEIQRKVNETFGKGKVTVELTGSGFDRVIRAENKTIFDFLDNNN